MKTITYYQFMQWDGCDRYNPREPAFLNKEDADEYIRDNKYDRFDQKTIKIYSSLDEYKVATDEELREQALAKLTDVEKEALGLS